MNTTQCSDCHKTDYLKNLNSVNHNGSALLCDTCTLLRESNGSIIRCSDCGEWIFRALEDYDDTDEAEDSQILCTRCATGQALKEEEDL